jgi:uncharacterized protein (TIGR02466 family)
MIEHIFPTAIYKSNVSCPQKEWEGMMDFCKEFYYKNLEEIEDTGNFTGDQDIPKFFLLHKTKEFYWLNAQMAYATRQYLSGMCRKTEDDEDYVHDIFFQKSWPNVCRLEDGGNPDHLHKGSHFSGIYYLRTEGDGGTLTLASESYMDNLPLNVDDDYCIYNLDPEDGDLIIFPSNILHRVTEFNGVDFRASIVYDIFVTSTINVDHNYENVVTSPHHWVQV